MPTYRAYFVEPAASLAASSAKRFCRSACSSRSCSNLVNRLAGWSGAAAGWAGGDSNYDLLVNLSDFALLASNFNRSLLSEPARSNVPEPTGLGVSAGLAIIRRRSRRA